METLYAITKENCGEHLKSLRKVATISQKDLAEKLGVSTSTIRRCEEGLTKATQILIQRICALNVIGTYKLAESKKEFSEENIATGLAALELSTFPGNESSVVAKLPPAIGFVGYGILKGLKAVTDTNNLEIIAIENGGFEIRVKIR